MPPKTRSGNSATGSCSQKAMHRRGYMPRYARKGFFLVADLPTFRQMETNIGWHGKAPNGEKYKQEMSELNAVIAELEATK